jgi:hypothetical protein
MLSVRVSYSSYSRLTSYKNIMEASQRHHHRDRPRSPSSFSANMSMSSSLHRPVVMISEETQVNFRPQETKIVQPNVEDLPEMHILLEHQQNLVKHIESLESQLHFVKEKRENDQDKSSQTVDRLTKQVNTLNVLLAREKEEKEQYNKELLEKERTLETSLVHLSSAQEEIKQLLQEKQFRESISVNESHKMNEMIQKHSKYSSQQFTKLSAQVDAMRVELHKEKSTRFQEKMDAHQENSLLTQKVHTLQSIISSLEEQLGAFSVNHDGTTTILKANMHMNTSSLSILKSSMNNNNNNSSSRKVRTPSNRSPAVSNSRNSSPVRGVESSKGSTPVPHRSNTSSNRSRAGKLHNTNNNSNGLMTSPDRRNKRMKEVTGLDHSPDEVELDYHYDDENEEKLLLQQQKDAYSRLLINPSYDALTEDLRGRARSRERSPHSPTASSLSPKRRLEQTHEDISTIMNKLNGVIDGMKQSHSSPNSRNASPSKPPRSPNSSLNRVRSASASPSRLRPTPSSNLLNGLDSPNYKNLSSTELMNLDQNRNNNNNNNSEKSNNSSSGDEISAIRLPAAVSNSPFLQGLPAPPLSPSEKYSPKSPRSGDQKRRSRSASPTVRRQQYSSIATSPIPVTNSTTTSPLPMKKVISAASIGTSPMPRSPSSLNASPRRTFFNKAPPREDQEEEEEEIQFIEDLVFEFAPENPNEEGMNSSSSTLQQPHFSPKRHGSGQKKPLTKELEREQFQILQPLNEKIPSSLGSTRLSSLSNSPRVVGGGGGNNNLYMNQSISEDDQQVNWEEQFQFKSYLVPHYPPNMRLSVSSSSSSPSHSPSRRKENNKKKNMVNKNDKKKKEFCSIQLLDAMIVRYNELIKEYNTLTKSSYHSYHQHNQMKEEYRSEIKNSVSFIYDLKMRLQEADSLNSHLTEQIHLLEEEKLEKEEQERERERERLTSEARAGVSLERSSLSPSAKELRKSYSSSPLFSPSSYNNDSSNNLSARKSNDQTDDSSPVRLINSRSVSNKSLSPLKPPQPQSSPSPLRLAKRGEQQQPQEEEDRQRGGLAEIPLSITKLLVTVDRFDHREYSLLLPEFSLYSVDSSSSSPNRRHRHENNEELLEKMLLQCQNDLSVIEKTLSLPENEISTSSVDNSADSLHLLIRFTSIKSFLESVQQMKVHYEVKDNDLSNDLQYFLERSEENEEKTKELTEVLLEKERTTRELREVLLEKERNILSLQEKVQVLSTDKRLLDKEYTKTLSFLQQSLEETKKEVQKSEKKWSSVDLLTNNSNTRSSRSPVRSNNNRSSSASSPSPKSPTPSKKPPSFTAGDNEVCLFLVIFIDFSLIPSFSLFFPI